MGTEFNLNLAGSVIAISNNLLLSAIFLARIFRFKKTEYLLGIIFILSAVPLIFILIKSIELNRALLYYIQLILMLCFIVTELILDYLLKIEFRKDSNIVIPYIVLFYASTGGMIGVAGYGGKLWGIIAIFTFLIMVTLSLFMHFKTKS